MEDRILPLVLSGLYAQVLGTAPVGLEGSIGGSVDQTLVPLLVAQLLERKPRNHKQPTTPWVRSAGSLEDTRGGNLCFLWERLMKAYQVHRGPCYLSAICRSPLLIMPHLHPSLLTLRMSIQNCNYVRIEVTGLMILATLCSKKNH